MPIIMDTLFGRVNYVDLAIERLRAFEPPEGYYLAFSGGKDSITLKRLADMAGVRYDAHYSLTTVDPPDLVQFIRREHPGVEIVRPAKTMWELIIAHRFPPMRQRRYCCQELKETEGAGRLVLTGIRAAESIRRAKRQMTEICLTNPSKRYLHPLIDWPTDAVWEFIRAERIPYCGLYDEGWERLGCILCPMASTAQRKRDAERWPKIAAQYVRTFDRLLVYRRAHGLATSLRFQTGAELFRWWVQHNAGGVSKEQLTMFA